MPTANSLFLQLHQLLLWSNSFQFIDDWKASIRHTLDPRLAFECEFLGSVCVHGTPVGLICSKTVVTNGMWLPWLIKGLKVEQIVSPCEGTADSSIPEGLGIGDATLGVGEGYCVD
jgi:hypothetical protein